MDGLALVDEIVDFLKKSTSNLIFETKLVGISKPPSIYGGFLPEKEDDDTEDINYIPSDYPFVIVQYLNDEDSIEDDGDVYKLQLIIGIYNESTEGWRDVLRVMTNIKLAIKENRLLGSFMLTGKQKSRLFEEQLYPFWHGIMEIEYTGTSIITERVDYGEHY